MIRQSHRALFIAAAGACLALSACGGGSATAKRPAASPTITAAPVPLTGHFCLDANAVMRQQPPNPAGQKTTLAVARIEMGRILKATAEGFRGLEPEAPAGLRASIKTITGIYASDQRQLAAFGSITEMGTSIVRANTTGAGRTAFGQVLTYITKHCK
jgi:hypothetical protein